MKNSKNFNIFTLWSVVISMIVIMIFPGSIVLGEESKSVQNDGAVEITSTTFESNTVAKDISNNLRIDYKILNKDKLKDGDKIVISLPDIFKDIEPKCPDQHFKDFDVKDGVVTLTFNENVEKAVTGYMIIRFVGNSNIRKGVSYPISIDLNGKPSTVYITGEEYSHPSSGGQYPLMYKTADLPTAATDKEQGREYYGEIVDRNKPIKYFVEINLGDGVNPNTRSYLSNADFFDNIPKGMALDVNSICIKRMGYYDERSSDVTKDFWESNRIKADTKHLEINFGDIRYERYTVIYETRITSTESGYLNDAKLYYDDDKELPSKHYSKLSKDAGALNVYKYVDKTKVKNNPNDQKIKYDIKFDSYGYFFKDTLNIIDKLDPRLSDIKITATDQFITDFDENTKELVIKNSNGDIDAKKPAYITIEASMKNVGPGEVVKNIAYVNGNPTNEVSTRKNPIVEFILSAEYDDPSLLEGAVFKLTTKEGETVRDIYNEEIKTFTFENGEPVSFELPDGVYNLEQIKAPEGYELNKTPIQFIVNEDSKVVKVPWEGNPIKTTVNLAIHKINEKGVPILGANFKLFKEENPKKPIKFAYNKNLKVYELDPMGGGKLIPSKDGASFKINNLPYGKYILKEVKAPKGYKLSDDIYITLDFEESFYRVGKEGKKIILNKNTETNTYDISVENVPRIILPETGGSGTSKFSFIGITLLAAVLSLVSTTEFVLKEREN
ncbi:SpaA isopeptide-forming pilin-related protein [Clostridium perfringens]|uniref:SpaA isopeptide-forming pilin-related protein n=1 Tax=Clostridium perfringens TaxID=1502 RepID=UPI000D70FF80|nr:SpaA isopeptide-forming pilin-related protein [Clostridium perfringens]EIF6174858.1 LPXTG cell wall anchor domain-containing protein [Clostridium perfringens]ELC8332611.1 LPXTG cell wall anchor domain-containing protein [Clostridium perfringens]ELC8342595.1 LPXTG cell wall anchor domain-containing protein [Clostridium perfringens]ELC8345630.1 LPXTG cell wall anchor domain-containing protein [Clostridium perfringens]ELC8399656.1 LPXTG cell wall anchor domain-containing protein [Clostridium p